MYTVVIKSNCLYEPRHEIYKNVVGATSKESDQPAFTRNLIRAEYSMTVRLLTEHYFEFPNLKGGCTG